MCGIHTFRLNVASIPNVTKSTGPYQVYGKSFFSLACRRKNILVMEHRFTATFINIIATAAGVQHNIKGFNGLVLHPERFKTRTINALPE